MLSPWINYSSGKNVIDARHQIKAETDGCKKSKLEAHNLS